VEICDFCCSFEWWVAGQREEVPEMKLNWENDVAGTPLSEVGGIVRESRPRSAWRYVQQRQGARMSFDGRVVPFAAVSDVEAVDSTSRRVTADLPKQFRVPLCPQESVP
jgi:hypothetical protein